jgi:iron complex transport system substrate-binding protein
MPVSGPGWRFRVLPCLLLGLLSGLFGPPAQSDPVIVVVDDRGRELRLEQPAQRIVTLAPHLTELLFAMGAGARVIATVDHSDHPPQALDIPRIGSAAQLDLERLLHYRPDLVLAWSTGSPRAQTARLEQLGVNVYYSEPTGFAGVAEDLRRLGHLAGANVAAEDAAQAFEQEIAGLRERYGARPPVTVFYQVWDRPLMTVNDAHLIGEAIRLCGGHNLFGAADSLVPRPGLEAVLAADPEVIVTGGPGEDRPDWLEPWRTWTGLMAVRSGNLFFVPPSLLQRHTPRIAEGARMLCEALDLARELRPETLP